MSQALILPEVQSQIEHDGLASPGDLIVVGVSGGPDSVCLLHVLRQIWDGRLRLHVAHLDHRLRGAESDADAAFVAELAAEWRLPVTVEHRDVARLAEERRLSLEEAGRQARYTFLAEVARRIGAASVAVGHNADDQVETFLMHLLRGSGLEGLRGMRPRAACPEDPPLQPVVPLIRPLLTITRYQIETYCQVYRLPVRRDPSNIDTRFYRNRQRHELLPLLETYNPRVRQVLLRTADIVAAEVDMLEALRDHDWERVMVRADAAGIVFDRALWRSLPLATRRALLRRAVKMLRANLRDFGFEWIEGAVEIVQRGQAGDQVTLPGGLSLRVGATELTIAPLGEPGPLPDWPLLFAREPVPVALPGITAVPGGDWTLDAQIMHPGDWSIDEITRNRDPWQAYLDLHAVTGDGDGLILRTGQPGEHFQPLGMRGRSTSLRRFWINCKVPQPWRPYLPIVSRSDRLIWLAGWRINERARVRPETQSVLWLRFHRGT